MAVEKFKTLLFILCTLCCVVCELGLPEGASCFTQGFNGTCVELGRCFSAHQINMFLTAGFRKSDFPELPDICSYKDKKIPIVCCTDCNILKGNETLSGQAVLPNGLQTTTDGTVAWKKCLEYFQRLPYKCHGVGNMGVQKIWNKKRKCHVISTTGSLAVGGRNAERWEFPHTALIGYGEDVRTADWLCGGSVISERFILTAAHCTAAGSLGNIKFAALGLLKRTDPKKYWKIHNIKRIINHPEYKPPSKYHDIALLETETEMNFGSNLLPACLDTGKEDKNVAEASGWGRLGHRQALADTLQVGNAGFNIYKKKLPYLPDICSYKNNEPVVCCTDCKIDEEIFRDYGVQSLGVFAVKNDTVAKEKCFDFFQKLPYPCRGKGKIEVKKIWNKQKKCHESRYGFALAVGGRDAQRWEFPHSALIGYGEDKETAEWLCGGSVISERFILTAAHCTSTNSLGSISYAALGLLKRSDPKKYWKIHKIQRIIIHPEYKAPSKYHDIALLETETEINFGRDLLPACLDLGFELKPFAEASGWGRLGYRHDTADNLQVVHLDEYNETECASIYGVHRTLDRGYDHEKQMCYGRHEVVADTCEGDSGGPLQISHFKCQYFVVGVTSFGKDCGVLGSAGMYTRVSYYVPWIESVVWPDEYEARKKKESQWLDKWLN